MIEDVEMGLGINIGDLQNTKMDEVQTMEKSTLQVKHLA